jgi:hypothetical protein
MIDRAVVDNLRIPWVRYSPAWPYLYWGLTILGAVYCAAAIAGQTGIGGCAGDIVACDAAAYYYADGYVPVEGVPQYGYSPAFLVLFAPFRLLSFDVFLLVWFGLHVAALLWLRAGWFLAIPGANEDVIRGNVTVFICVALVLALGGRAWAWAFPLLTKVLPGVGMVWHLVRREWRSLAIATGATFAVLLVGVAVDPQAWVEWVELLQGHGTGTAGNLLPRLVLAAGIVAFAGLTSRAWLVPIGMIAGWSFIGPPVLMMLAALPRLYRDARDPRLIVSRIKWTTSQPQASQRVVPIDRDDGGVVV